MSTSLKPASDPESAIPGANFCLRTFLAQTVGCFMGGDAVETGKSGAPEGRKEGAVCDERHDVVSHQCECVFLLELRSRIQGDWVFAVWVWITEISQWSSV